jgi:tetratricopeptide (TPR) repeat protein/LPS sulfotransferase NodH
LADVIKKKRQRPNIELQRLIQSGLDALHDNNVVEASRICAEALKQAPRMPRAHFLAGLIALSSGDRGAAERAFEATVRVNDKHAAAWARLAQLYTTSGRVRMAEASLHNAAHAQRGNPATLDLIGTVFRLAGNLDASREWHQRAVDGDPRHVPFLMNLANAHNYCGDVDAARDVLRRCLAIEPRNAQAHWLLSRAESATSREHVEQMQGLLEESGSESDAAYLHYAIGKELEDLEDWDGAFGSWSTGAAIRRNSISWDEAQDIELFETLEETFTHDWLPAHEGVCFDAGPIFIVGQPRTGTTLLDRMLDAHPVVASGGELRFFGFAVRQAAGIDEPRQFSASLMRRAAETDATAIGEAYVDLAATLRTDSAHIVDKLPSNYLYLPLIFAALPNARVIHMRRDPMDACLAIYKQLFADAYLYSYDLGELARHYQRYERLMALWRERFGDRFIEVDYEKLAADPEVNLRRVLQYIGLSWEPRCLEYFKEASSVMTASAMQVREAPHQRSVGRWKHFERQLQPVAEVLL